MAKTSVSFSLYDIYYDRGGEEVESEGEGERRTRRRES